MSSATRAPRRIRRVLSAVQGVSARGRSAPGASVSAIEEYAAEVVAGRLPAGKYHRLACVRHLKELTRQGTPEFPYHFELEHAEHFFKFAALLKHYKGEWAGQPIVLSAFQRFRLGCIFGWRHATTGLRRFTTAYNELPRKS